MTDQSSAEEIRPFRIAVPQPVLDDLGERIAKARWTEELPGVGWDYGVPTDQLRVLVDYWETGYDWRNWEAKLNRYPQFTTRIDGQQIQFLHVRSPETDALPLILTHGWPGSIVEYLDIIGPLTNPREHGARGATAFDLVIPSLPGFGFSGPTTERGWNVSRIARAWVELMRRLGYDRYGAAGNDWGSHISPQIGRTAPEAVVGVHVTQIYPFPTRAELGALSTEEQEAMDGLSWFEAHMDAYARLQSQQPQSLAHALSDSPVGLLGWYSLIFREGLDADFVLTNLMTYWVTGTVASAMRLYYEHNREDRISEPTTVPIGVAQFKHEVHAIRRFADRTHSRITSWNVYDTGGHYAAHQEPELLANDLRAFFSEVRGQR